MTRFVRRTLLRTALAAAVFLATAGPAVAAPAGAAGRIGYVTRFKDYWGGMFTRSNGITLIVLATGAVSLFIITRGKWRK